MEYNKTKRKQIEKMTERDGVKHPHPHTCITPSSSFISDLIQQLPNPLHLHLPSPISHLRPPSPLASSQRVICSMCRERENLPSR